MCLVRNSNNFAKRLDKGLDAVQEIPRTRGRLAAVARYCGVSHTSANKWFHGEALPDSENLKKLCELLGVSSDWLLYGETEIPPENNQAPFPLFSWDNFIEQKKLFDSKDIVPTEYYYFDKSCTQYDDAFAIKIPTNVPAPYMFHNAYILFSGKKKLKHDDLLLVQYGDDIELKRLVKGGNTAFLKSFNKDIPNEPVIKDTKILGAAISSHTKPEEFKG